MSANGPIADIPDRWHKLRMRWVTAFKWALPVWLVTIAAVGALMFFTDFVWETGAAEAIRRFTVVVVVALPLIAWLIKASSEDLAAYRAAFETRDSEEGKS